jgi:hypothetical protein
MHQIMVNSLGYAASSAVLASFLMRRMVPLRLLAILSNVLFTAFGLLQHIYPVLLLHLTLLPINLWRLYALGIHTEVTQRLRRLLPRRTGDLSRRNAGSSAAPEVPVIIR